MARKETPQALGRSESDGIEASGRTRRRTVLGDGEGSALGRRLRAHREQRQARQGQAGRTEPNVRTHLTTSGVYSPAQEGMGETQEREKTDSKRKIGKIAGVGALAAGAVGGFWLLRRRGRRRENW